MHTGAITTIVGLWFDRQRGLAISLALNGASFGGILITPALVIAIETVGFPGRHGRRRRNHGDDGACRPPALDRSAAGANRATRHRPQDIGHLDTRQGAAQPAFWSVAGPFAVALMAQIGFIVHQIAFLEPAMGRPLRRPGGRRHDGHGGRRTHRARRIHRAMGCAARHRVVGREPGGRAACDDADNRRRAAVHRLRGVRPIGRQPDHAAGGRHPARIRGGVVRHAGRAVDRDRPVHLRDRTGAAWAGARSHRRLRRLARALHGAGARRSGGDSMAPA